MPEETIYGRGRYRQEGHANVLIRNNHAVLAYWREKIKELPEIEWKWDEEGRGLWVCQAIFRGDSSKL